MSRPARTNHGEYGYAHRYNCRCTPCITAVAAYAKRLRLDQHRGVSRTRPAEPVRRHLQTLLDQGYTMTQIANVSGVTRSQIKRMFEGSHGTGKPVTKLLAHTAQKLLAVTPAALAGQLTFVSSVGLHRRIHALNAMGHTKADVAAALGVTESTVFQYLQREVATTDVIAKVHRVYEAMSMRHGDSETMRWKARRLGWLPPLAWDEDTIDDPAAVPDRSVVRCAVSSCSRSIQVGSLCDSHHRTVKARDGYRSARRFRENVLRLGQAEVHDAETLRASLAELKAHGCSMEEAARRVNRRRKYIEKLWYEVRPETFQDKVKAGA